jgi:hypothetical protein
MSFLIADTPVEVTNVRHRGHVDVLLKRAAKTTKWGVALIEFTDAFDTSLMARGIAWSHADRLLVGEARG